jgi:DNA-binding transcriptional MerR regulator
MEDKRYTIGQMARLCNVTTKQLRHYDENKVLCPHYKDEGTNYRYYCEKQIEEILLIKELKGLGMSLRSISALLAKRDLSSLRAELEESIIRAKSELHAARRKYDQSIESLLRVIDAISLLGRPSAPPDGPACQIVNFPVRQVVYTRYKCYWNAKKLFIARRAELYGIIDEFGLTTSGPNMAIFHSDYLKQFSDRPEDCEGDLEICMNAASAESQCPHCRPLGGFKAVSAIHVGHYRFMEPAYRALEQWADQQGLELHGVSIEEYIAGATMTNNEDNYVTRIYLPLKGSKI